MSEDEFPRRRSDEHIVTVLSRRVEWLSGKIIRFAELILIAAAFGFAARINKSSVGLWLLMPILFFVTAGYAASVSVQIARWLDDLAGNRNRALNIAITVVIPATAGGVSVILTSELVRAIITATSAS